MVLVPTQNNGYDCGIFTCHFAYALYQLRNQCFTYHAIYKERSPLLSKVTNAELFNFDQLLANDFQNHLGQLIDNLSAMYRLPTIEGPFDIFMREKLLMIQKRRYLQIIQESNGNLSIFSKLLLKLRWLFFLFVSGKLLRLKSTVMQTRSCRVRRVKS